MPDGAPDGHAAMDAREVVEETVVAYHTQKLSDGSVRFKSGGHVVEADTYFEALERYAKAEKERIEGLPEHLADDRWESIHDGMVPLFGFDSSGFTPLEILNAVTAHHPEDIERSLGGVSSSTLESLAGRWRASACGNGVPDEPEARCAECERALQCAAELLAAIGREGEDG